MIETDKEVNYFLLLKKQDNKANNDWFVTQPFQKPLFYIVYKS